MNFVKIIVGFNLYLFDDNVNHLEGGE